MQDKGHISRKDLLDSAMLFAVLHQKPTFRARDFSTFSEIAAIALDEELANEILLEAVTAGFLREIGPGIYAVVQTKNAASPLEQPLWTEDRSA